MGQLTADRAGREGRGAAIAGPFAPAPFDPTARRRFWSIQVLRIAGAYGVVLAHYTATQNHGHDLMKGVDIFFVISGFLVWLITSRLKPTPWAFLFNRITRLAPLYWLAIALGVALKLAWPRTYWQFDLDTKHVLLSMLFVPHFDPTGHMYPFIGQGWTLNLDVFYYLLFALCLFIPRCWRLAAMSGVFVGCVLFGVVERAHHHGAITQNYSHPLVLAFGLGVWIAEAWLRGWLRSRRVGAAAAFAGAALFALASATDLPYAGWDIAVWVLASCLGLAGLLAMEGGGVELTSPWLERLSDWSYAIYLFHQVVMMLVLVIAPRSPLVALPLLLAGATLSGWMGYALFERPCNVLFRRLEKAHLTVAISPRQRLPSIDASLTELAP